MHLSPQAVAFHASRYDRCGNTPNPTPKRGGPTNGGSALGGDSSEQSDTRHLTAAEYAEAQQDRSSAADGLLKLALPPNAQPAFKVGRKR